MKHLKLLFGLVAFLLLSVTVTVAKEHVVKNIDLTENILKSATVSAEVPLVAATVDLFQIDHGVLIFLNRNTREYKTSSIKAKSMLKLDTSPIRSLYSLNYNSIRQEKQIRSITPLKV